MTKRRLVVLCALAGVLVLAACQGQTDPADHVRPTTADLNGHGNCISDVDGNWHWELQEEAGAFVQVSDELPWACPADEAPGTPGYQCTSSVCTTDQPLRLALGERELSPSTDYCFRLAADVDPQGGPYAYQDSTGSSANHNWDCFTTPNLFEPGLAGTADHQKSCRAADSLGATHIRMEYNVAATAASLASDVDYCADRGVRLLLLANWGNNTLPSQAQAENLATWADTYGPHGSFWTGRADGHLAVQQIEFGNEDSYCYRHSGGPVGSYDCSGAWYNDPDYQGVAGLYATRAEQAAAAIAPKNVDLLVQADNGGVGDQWVDGMADSQPDLDDSVGGWSVHPYGPETQLDTKLNALKTHTAAEGWDATIPIDVTEWGMATDCISEPPTCPSFPASPGNFGFPLDMTYAEAGTQLTTAIAAMRAEHGARLRDMMFFGAHDGLAHGTSTNREGYMGCVASTEADKGAYSTACRNVLDD